MSGRVDLVMTLSMEAHNGKTTCLTTSDKTPVQA